MPYKDKQQQSDFQNKWVRKRRRKWIKENGPCIKCGSRHRLEVDHIDPTTKSVGVAQIWGRKKEVRDAELLKCQVLCHRCHKEKTASEAHLYERPNRMVPPSGKSWCSGHRDFLPLDDFSVHRGHTNGRHGVQKYCRQCKTLIANKQNGLSCRDLYEFYQRRNSSNG